MEAEPAALTGAGNGGFQMPAISLSSSQPSRKEWRVVTEQSARNSGDEELERSKLVQADERLIYEVNRGREPADVDFCSITVNGGSDNDIIQQRLIDVTKQREQWQQMEIELRAQVITRSLQNNFDMQMKEHANANAKLQEQLHDKEQKIHELERKMEGMERELHAVRLDNQKAWAKNDIIMEQRKELQSYRIEMDNNEAERVQHIKQIHDFQEHIQEKDRLFMELQEQHRIAQESINFKDEQLRDAQAWITRALEIDALQTTTNHTLQAELRERTEHYNQLWLGCQRQFAEMERLHMHIQGLQLELADVREKSGIKVDDSHTSQTNLNNASDPEKSNGSQLEVNGNASQSAKSGGLQSEISESASGGNTSTPGNHAHVVTFPPSVLGMPPYITSGQMTALHPYLIHQQGVPYPQHVLQSHFNSVSAMPSSQNWQDQQPQPDGQHGPTQNQYPQESEQNVSRTDFHYGYGTSGNGQILCVDYLDTNISQCLGADSVAPSANGEGKVIDSIDNTNDNNQSPQSLQRISSQFCEALSLDPLEHGKDAKENPVVPLVDYGIEIKNTVSEHSNLAVNGSSFEAPANAKSLSDTTPDTASSVDLAGTVVAAGKKNNLTVKPVESYLLDERALLASIARTIGYGGRIRISTTLPNKLAKMLAPLHWHDYTKKYGKLDDFVASHPELFSIEGDYIHLREGAQSTIVATAAVAEVAAAAPSLYSSLFPAVAITPMAQPQRPKKAPPLESVGFYMNDKHK
ncbi:hypothetical protein CASFOL_006995 [Castilleja foliolosa]|uniref:DUF7725 domain-containing protein n=1 Tax=Castilleja foliolosa TaxID=1961234 RepID=A0ABD3E8I8_9LAMI